MHVYPHPSCLDPACVTRASHAPQCAVRWQCMVHVLSVWMMYMVDHVCDMTCWWMAVVAATAKAGFLRARAGATAHHIMTCERSAIPSSTCTSIPPPIAPLKSPTRSPPHPPPPHIACARAGGGERWSRTTIRAHHQLRPAPSHDITMCVHTGTVDDQVSVYVARSGVVVRHTRAVARVRQTTYSSVT